MCQINNIDCNVVEGYGKGKKWLVGSNFSSNHAWNTIKLNDTVFYYDCTWGAGYTDDSCNRFTRNPTMDFYRVPDSLFHFSHLGKPQKSDTGFYNKFAVFKDYPLTSGGFFQNKIYSFYPMNGVIEVQKDSIILFKLFANGPLAIVSFRSDDVKHKINEVAEPKKGKNGIYFNYTADKLGFYYLIVYVNFIASLVYKLRVM